MLPENLISCTDSSLKLLKRTIEEHSGRIPGKTKLRQILGEDVDVVACWLKELESAYGNALVAREAIDAIIQTRSNSKRPEELFDLIISGPEVSEVPTCETLTTIHDLIHTAQEEILICDYAIYGAQSIFTHLESAIQKRPDLKIRMILHLFEDQQGRSGRIERFAKDFVGNHWRASRLPELYVDPRNLASDFGTRTSMHAKCYIADRKQALITSANLTDAAHHKNIEAGIIVKYPSLVERLAKYFDGLIADEYLQRVL